MIYLTIIGTITGTLLGLVPGIHPNNIAPLLITLPLIEEKITVFAASATASFTLSSHIPSILIGSPSGEDLSVLPGHKLTRKGRGITAIYLTLKGSLIAITMAPVIGLSYLLFSKKLYPSLSILIPFFLVIITVSMIKNKKSLLVVIMATFLGISALEDATIMPMLTGLFGISTLITSLKMDKKIKKQKIKPIAKTKNWKTTRSATLSTILSSILGIIPAVSSALSATIGKKLGKMNKEEYLAFIGASNTTYNIASFLALIYLGKTRSGTTVALSSIKYPESPLLIITAIMTSTAISYILLRKNLHIIAKFFNRINHKKTSLIAIILLIALNLFLTNLKGMIVLITSTAIGITTIKLKVPRINNMSCLTIPTALLLI